MHKLLLIPPLLTGCLRDLPTSPIGPLAVDLFRAFDEDVASLPTIVAAIDAEMDGLDQEASPKARLIDLPELTVNDFGGADVGDGLDTKNQMRAGMFALSRHNVDNNLRAQVQVNMTCANARAVTCHERRPVKGSDAQAFLDGTVAHYSTENTIRIETVPVDFWIQAPGDFRRVSLDDGRQAAVGRTWIREPFTNDNDKRQWRQRFGVDVYIADPDDPGRTRRFFGSWSGPSVDGYVGAFTQTAIRRGLDDGFTRPDDWLDEGEPCDVDLDACLADAPF